MNQEASREILWNLDPFTTSVIMYSMLAMALLVAFSGIWRRFEFISSGKESSERFISPFERVIYFLDWVLFQRGVLRSPQMGLAHTLIYVGFLALLFTTTMVFLDHDFGFEIYRGQFYLAVTVMSDLLGLGLLIGCAIAAHRRYIARPDLLHTRRADGVFLGFLALLCIQGFLLEGLRIQATQDPWAAYSPVGYAVGQLFWALSPKALSWLHFLIWWFHTATVMLAVAFLPYSKLFHVVASSANLFFAQSKRARGALEFPGDIEQLMEQEEEFSLGLGSIKDYNWKQLLDLDACTSCGRCQDACPAYNSGKMLSPKWMILDTRNHALHLHADGKLSDKSALSDGLRSLDSSLLKNYIAASSDTLANGEGQGLVANGSFRASNELTQQATRTLGANAEDRIAGDVMDPDVFWSCNTCFACVEACPVGINHVDIIVGNRRNMALMHGEIPSEASATLRALETRGNPYGAPEDRVKWLEDLNVKILKEGDEVDYLYWVGCVSSYDPRKQKIARSLVNVMQKAGLSFGVLGTAEGCSGDPARRIGEENLFQTLAKTNLEVLRGIRFEYIVANCPHCFNTIKNEYPQLGNLGEGRSPEIIHHSVLLKRLLADGRISLQDSANHETVVFHDPCYLGRVNDEYQAPRDTLKANSSLQIIEMEQSKEKSYCCGAGGGHFWMDMKVGERVNVQRVNQAAATGASTIASACPFCMQMLEDGIKLSNREDQMRVKDIAEFISENLD